MLTADWTGQHDFTGYTTKGRLFYPDAPFVHLFVNLLLLGLEKSIHIVRTD